MRTPVPTTTLTDSSSNASGTQSIERTVALLRELATAGVEGARLVDLAGRTQIEYPTAHRMVQCLVKQRLIAKDPTTRRYSLGPLVYELGLAAKPRLDPRRLCEPMLQRLAEITGDTVFLNIRSGLDAVCVDRREGTCPIKVHVYEVGARRPLGVGAGGLALLMRLPWPEIQEVVKENASRLAACAGLSPQSVFAALRRARDIGHVVTSGVLVPGITSVALPFGGAGSMPAAAVTVSTVSSRMPVSRQRELVQEIALAIADLERTISEGAMPERAA